MKNTLRYMLYYIKNKINKKNIDSKNVRNYLKNRDVIYGRQLLSADSLNLKLMEMINDSLPFFVGRLGATELSAMRVFDFQYESKYKKMMNQMQMWSGIFPTDIELGIKFKNLMLNVLPEIDLIGVWLLAFEDYYVKNYTKKDILASYLLDLEPWCNPECPWTAALKGKKVLVIHPFANTIESQYRNRDKIFPGTEILPEFELYTLRAVQTIAGKPDPRFRTWFDALDWMYNEAMSIDFDVSIIGCGAYGFPLAAKLKCAGKKAIHLGGATQILFGIKGKRWEENPAFAYIQKYFNEYWIKPGDDDRPKHADKVEDGCYW